MKLLLTLLCLYPPGFRAQFQQQMIDTLRESHLEARRFHEQSEIAFLLRESWSIVVGAALEWLSLGAAGLMPWLERSHRLAAFTLAAAVQAFTYGSLVPIGGRARNTTGAGLYELGGALLLLTVVIAFISHLAQRLSHTRNAQ